MNGSTGRPARYAGRAAVASWLGRDARWVTDALFRHAPGRKPPFFPVPDVVIEADGREIPGWLPSRRGEWEAWAASLPGQGKGGGRPRKQP